MSQRFLTSSFVVFASLVSSVAFSQDPTPQTGRARASSNPDTSVSVLGLLRKSNLGNGENAAKPNGLMFQEAELQFTSDVDPYLRASALFSIAPTEGAGLHGTDFSLGAEEVFFETLSLPSVTFKVGKFKAALGRHNLLHTHAFNFIDAPLVNSEILSEEGLNEMGVSAAILLPLSWYSEWTVQGLRGDSELLFASPNPNVFAGVTQFKNLFDFTDTTTFEVNLFGAYGANRYDRISMVSGADVTLKWRPVSGPKASGLSWTAEYLQSRILGNEIGGNPLYGSNLGGVATWVQYQFAERWWIQARAEVLGLPIEEGLDRTQKQSALLGFYPSEFSGFRLQYDHQQVGEATAEHVIQLQYNLAIGAHPAHSY
jgi:hypothetical protein